MILCCSILSVHCDNSEIVIGVVQWVKWHPRGHVLLAGSEDVTAWLWNADTAACMAVLSGHSGAVTCGDFTPDGKLCLLFFCSA